MLYKEKRLRLKDGREVLLRSPVAGDAAELTRYLLATTQETEFVLRYPEECSGSVEEEAAFLSAIEKSPNALMISAWVGDRVVGTCQIDFLSHLKTRHRAGVAIAVLRDFWGQGLGSVLLRELIAVARERGAAQLELEYIEGNDRAAALYRRLGFRETGRLPDGYRLRDGGSYAMIQMVLKL